VPVVLQKQTLSSKKSAHGTGTSSNIPQKKKTSTNDHRDYIKDNMSARNTNDSNKENRSKKRQRNPEGSSANTKRQRSAVEVIELSAENDDGDDSDVENNVAPHFRPSQGRMKQISIPELVHPADSDNHRKRRLVLVGDDDETDTDTDTDDEGNGFVPVPASPWSSSDGVPSPPSTVEATPKSRPSLPPVQLTRIVLNEPLPPPKILAAPRVYFEAVKMLDRDTAILPEYQSVMKPHQVSVFKF
jgi:hypothetical protein